MKTYKIPVTYLFSGVFFIAASSEEEAREKAENHCGLVIGGDIHSTLNNEDVQWDFYCHPETRIGEIAAAGQQPPQFYIDKRLAKFTY
jgi:hypothetical protein